MKPVSKILIALCLLCICGYIGINIVNAVNTDYNYCIKTIQKKIFTFDDDADSLYQDFIKTEIKQNDYYNFFDNYNITKYATILIYKNSELIFWSDNKSNYNTTINNHKTNDSIINTTNSIAYTKYYSLNNTDVIIQLPILYRYNIENKYLQNKYNDFFKLSSSYDIIYENIDEIDENTIVNKDNTPLFNISNKILAKNKKINDKISDILLITSICFLIIIILFNCKCFNSKHFILNVLYGILIIIAAKIIIILINYLIPSSSSIYNTEFFYYDKIFSCTADVFTNTLLILILSTFISNQIHTLNLKKNINNKILCLLISCAGFVLAFYLVYIIERHCSPDMELIRLINFDLNSFLILSSVIFIITSCILINYTLLNIIFNKHDDNSLNYKTIILIGAMSIITTLIIVNNNNEKEYYKAKKIAENNIFIRNRNIENVIITAFQNVENDSVIYNLSINNIIQNANSITLNNRIETINNKYLPNYFINYTIADSTTKIVINEDTTTYNCNSFFYDYVKNNGKISDVNNLWFINQLDDIPYYIYLLKTKNYNIWLDIVPAYNIDNTGYPELMSSKNDINSYIINLAENSFAIYIDNILIRNFGVYSYNFYISDTLNTNSYNDYSIYDNYKHYFFHEDDGITIVVSKPYSIQKLYIFPFALIFVYIIIIYFICIIICNSNTYNINNSLKQKIQQSTIIYFIVISFLIGFFSIFIILSINNNKNKLNLIDKTHSILNEIINNYSKIIDDNYDFSQMVNDLSSIHFAEINIYSEKGQLIGTSNEEMFLNNLTSSLINSEAFNKLQTNNRFITKEKIGNYQFLSSYMAFVNDYGDVYYLNLPYFTKQNILKKEISDYIELYIDLYIIIIFFTLIITYFLSKYITRPLGMLKEKLSKLTIENENEKIEYFHDDEIGKLVEVYNNKVDELQKSVKLLAETERESAWREMARQVAHEIKNPLTPMKLSTQYIYKYWKENRDNFGEHFAKFENTMVTQIDTLSEIATAFSDFAKMPEPDNKIIDLNSVIYPIIDFYKQCNIDIKYETTEKEILISSDKALLSRVFNNLIRNSIQAFTINDKNKTLSVVINSQIIDNKVVIIIKDNGPGINDATKDKIFLPNFTTKTSGMGLGLAIVKNIINNSNGKIENITYTEGAMFKIIFNVEK